MQKTNLNLKAFPLEKVIKNLSKEQTTERQQKIKEILSLREIVGSEHTTELIEALTTADQLTGPDENGNYILTKNEEMQLIDKYGEPIGDLSDDPIMQSVINTYLDTTNESEKLGALTFDYLLPYKKGIYLARKGQNLFYIDAITGLPIEEDKKDTITLQRQEHKEVINQVFSSILFTYDIYLINKKGIDFSQLMETSEKLTKNYKKLINALYGVYRYLYHGEITPQLAWKNSELRNGLLDFPDFKAKYPDLYLAAHELQKIKEILINKKGKVIGYIEKKGEKYGYKTPDKQWKEGLEFDDFRGPDIHGNIITVINGESFFINIDFPLQKAAFKQIEGPDENGNYIAHQNNHTHYLIKKNGTLCGNVRNQIEKPDLNNNYLTSHEGDFCLIDSNGDKISDFYLHIKNADENGYYLATSTQGVNILDKGGYKVVPQFYQNIKRLPSGDYQMQDQGKFWLYSPLPNKKFIPCEYDEIISFSPKTYFLQKGKECGLRNREDKEGMVVPLGKYDNITPPDERGLSIVIRIDKDQNLHKISQGLIDPRGKEIISCEWDNITWNERGIYTTKKRRDANDVLEIHYRPDGIYSNLDIKKDKEKAEERIQLQIINTKNEEGEYKWCRVDKADENGCFLVMSYDKEYQTYRIGLMKDQLTEIIPCVYDTISLDEEGRYVAKLPDKIHYFNADQILLDFKQGDERKANRDIINKAYHDLINSEKWDMVDKPDRNGFCRVMKIDTEEGKILFGVMRDPETEELPVIYDLIEMNENGSYTVKKDGETDILDCKNGKYKIH